MGLKNKGQQLGMVVRLSRPISYGAPFHLEITDQTSRMVIMEVELDAEAFADLMSNREARGVAGVTRALDRIGKRVEHETHTLPWSAFKDQAEADAAGRSWADDNGWETVTLSKNNVGRWVMTGRRWVEP